MRRILDRTLDIVFEVEDKHQPGRRWRLRENIGNKGASLGNLNWYPYVLNTGKIKLPHPLICQSIRSHRAEDCKDDARCIWCGYERIVF